MSASDDDDLVPYDNPPLPPPPSAVRGAAPVLVKKEAAPELELEDAELGEAESGEAELGEAELGEAELGEAELEEIEGPGGQAGSLSLADSDTIATPIANLMGAGLRFAGFFDQRRGLFEAYQKLMSLLSTWLVLAGGLTGSLFFLVMAIKLDGLAPLGLSLAMLVAALVLHFLCSRMAFAGTRLVKSDPCRVGTGGIMECLGIFYLLVAVFALFGGLYIGIRQSEWRIVVWGLAFFACYGFGALCVLNPRTSLNILPPDGKPVTAGETALSLGYLFLRLTLLSVPSVVVATLAVGIIGAWVGIIRLAAASGMALAPAAELGIFNVTMIVAAGLYPLLAYILYAGLSLFLELCRSVMETARNTRGRG